MSNVPLREHYRVLIEAPDGGMVCSPFFASEAAAVLWAKGKARLHPGAACLVARVLVHVAAPAPEPVVTWLR